MAHEAWKVWRQRRGTRDVNVGLGSRLGLQGPWVVHLALKVWTVSRQTEAPEPDT